MKTPKWQRARVLVKDPSFHNRLVWLRIEQPSVCEGENSVTGKWTRYERALTSHILHPTNGYLGGIDSTQVELLARGPEDFADDVALVTWEQWLKESAPEKPHATR